MAASVDKYLKVLSDLLPNGKAWQDIKCSPLVRGLSHEFARIEDAIRNFLEVELDPRTTTELLPDWEKMLGIPDECTPDNLTLAERREQVTQKWTAQGGINAEYYEFVAEQLGFDVEVVNIPDFRVGISRVGEALTNHDVLENTRLRVGYGRVGERLRDYGWRFFFIVRLPASELRRFRVGENRVGDRLVDFGNELLECTFKKLKPAHNGVLFRFV